MKLILTLKEESLTKRLLNFQGNFINDWWSSRTLKLELNTMSCEKIEKFFRNQSIYAIGRLPIVATALEICNMFYGHGLVNGGI